MTPLTVQLIMGGLGLLTGLLIALLGPGKRWIRWPLAIASAAGVAITAWPELWLVESSPIRQLYQSLLLGSVVVLTALLTMMLLHPSRRVQSRADALSTTTNETSSLSNENSTAQVMHDIATPEEPGRDEIRLDLNRSPDAIIANQDEHALMHLLGSAKKPAEIDDAEMKLDEDANEMLLVEVADDIALVDPDVEAELNQSIPAADVVSLAEHRELRDGAAAADALDLSDSEELYQAMRDAEAELDLTEEPTWVHDDVSAEIQTQRIDDAMDAAVSDALDADIEDAEILEDAGVIGEHDYATTADLPITEDSDEQVSLESSNDSMSNDGVPATLSDALQAQRQSIQQLNSDTDVLAERLSEWRAIADNNEQAAWTSSLLQSQTVQQQQEQIVAENNFRQAAVELIHTQRDVMRKLMRQIDSLGAQREADLATLTTLQKSSLNQQRVARQAALLARQAAADKQSLNGRLTEERRNHQRTQGTAKRAMDIARDAVDKLAAHERRLGISNTPGKPDSQG